MNRANHNYLNELEAQLRAMHQPHEFSDELIQQDRFENDFEREFGAGDEQQARPARIDQVQFAHGHIDGDFC